MIGYIKGKVLYAADGTVLLENNGVGYEIVCSASVYAKLAGDRQGEVYTYMSVREDGVSLYGFIDREEKQMFLKLISVSGVGPKMGITILSNMRLTDLAVKIASSDVKGLSAVKGLGKKTAERIILELREKINAVDKDTGEILADSGTVEADDDAVIALMSLGFTRNECARAVRDAKNNGAASLEQIIAWALKHIK